MTITTRDEALTDPLWSKPRIFIQNDGTEALQLFKIRYYFLVESGKEPRIELWEPNGLATIIVQEQNGQAYAEIDLGGITLAPGESYRWGNGMQFGLHYADWSSFDKNNDWSEPSVGSGSALNPHITLHDAFGDWIAGLAPGSGSSTVTASSSSTNAAVLDVSVTEESTEATWSKSRIRIHNTSSGNVSIGDISFSVTGDLIQRPEAQVFDPSGITVRWDSLGLGQWIIHLQMQTTLSAGQSWNWGNGIFFGIHNADWSSWNHLDDAGLLAIRDPAGNLLFGNWTPVSSSSQGLSSSSLPVSSSSSYQEVSSSSISVSIAGSRQFWTNVHLIPVSWSINGVAQTTDTVEVFAQEGAHWIKRSSGNARDSVLALVDWTAPVVQINSPANGDTVRVSSIGVTWSVDGVSRTDSAALQLGANTITRSATDLAGNTTNVSIPLWFRAGAGTGLVAVAKAPDTAFAYTEVEISGALSQSPQGVRARYSLRQIGGDSVQIMPQGPFFSVLARDSGTIQFELTVADAQGNLVPTKDTVSILVREPASLVEQLDLLQDAKSAQEGAAGITITSPTRDASQSTLDAFAFLQGFVPPATSLGSIQWKTDKGHSGTFQPISENWKGLSVPLEKGDNFITLVYQDGSGSRAADHLLVTRGDSAFAWNLALNPNTLQVGTPLQVEATANVLGAGLEKIELVNVDRDEEYLADLNDDAMGQDSVAQDALFSGGFSRTPVVGERYRFRVKLTTAGGVYWSKVYFQALQQSISIAHSDSVNAVQDAAANVYTTIKATLGKAAAMDALVTWLGQQSVVEMAGVSPDSQAVSWISTEGVYCLLPDAPEGTRGGRIHTKTLSPYYYDFKPWDDGHLTNQLFTQAAAADPSLWNNDPLKANTMDFDNNTPVAEWSNWDDYRAIVVPTHGNTFGFDWNRNIYKGDTAKQARKSRFKKPFVVQDTKDSVVTGLYPGLESSAPNVMPSLVNWDETYAVTPRYLQENSKMGEFVFWAGSCRSAYNHSLWDALRTGSGKNQAFFGFTDYVQSVFAAEASKIVFKALVQRKTAQEAYDSVVTFCGSLQAAGICGLSNGEPYDLDLNTPSRLKLFGDPQFRLIDTQVMAAGANTYGQLGDSSFVASDTLVQVKGFSYGRAVAAGANTSYILDQSGHVYSWGRDSLEELGNGPGGSAQTAPVAVFRRNYTTSVIDTLPRIAGLAASMIGTVSDSWKSGHALALDSSGFVYAWGANNSGQLGTGLYGIATSRARLVSYLSNIQGIAAGRTFSLALDAGGVVWSWGKNANRVLGIGNLAAMDSIQPVPGNVRMTGGSNLGNVASIAAGDLTSFAIRNDGSVWSWGSNIGGEMGISRSTLASSTGFATRVSGLSGQGIQKIRLGEDHGLALDASGRVWSWGTNTHGQLGNGSVGGLGLPALVPGIPSKIVDIATGAAFSVALDEHGAVYVWGANTQGQLGLGDHADRATPTPLVYGDVRLIAAGNYHIVLVK